MVKKSLQLSTGIVIVALLLVTIFSFAIGSYRSASTGKVNGPVTHRSTSTSGTTYGLTAIVGSDSKHGHKGTPTVTATVPVGTPTVSPTDSPSPTPTVPLRTGIASIWTFGEYGAATVVSFSGSGFLPGEQIALYWNYQHQEQFQFATVTADSNGRFQFSAATPSDPNLGQGYYAGIGLTSHYLATDTIPEPAGIIAYPYETVIGKTVKFVGGGFDANERISVVVDGTQIGVVTTDHIGGFTASLLVPTSTPPGCGSNVLIAIGQTSGMKVYASYFCAYFNYPVTVSPTSGPVGTSVTITGAKFTPNGLVYISWITQASAPAKIGQVTASPTGTFTITVTAPLCPGPLCGFSIVDSINQSATAEIMFPES